MNGKIIVNLTRNWHLGIPHVRGTMFDGTKKLSPDEAQSTIRVLNDRDAVTSFLKESNGFFSVVNVEGNNGWIAVDRIRSLPLFYGQHNGKLFISDDARWVRKHVHDNEMNPIAREEFLACGYVTGSDTLFPNVKQVQAGEVVFFQPSEDSDIIVEPLRYYRYVHGNYFEDETEILFRKLDETLINVFQNLISYASGRTIVIPLSGGYDSRLVALMLKKIGYKNIVAFSYGKPGNREAEVSNMVAKKLGISWEFVPYSNDNWYKWYRSDEMKAYSEFADGLVSLPHIQDWPAVLMLKKENRIPDEAVFVPGHTADKLTGSLSEVFPDIYRLPNYPHVTRAILETHYNLNASIKNNIIVKQFEWRVLRTLGDFAQYPDSASIYESWDVSERQPKFIVNSLRVYEFFGYDWWIPFWDKGFMNFWCRVSKERRLYQCFYKKYVDMISEQQGLSLQDLQIKTEKAISIKEKIRSVAERALPKGYRWMLPEAILTRHIENHPMGSLGRFPREDVIKLLRQGYSSNGIAAYFYIKGLEENLRKGEV